MCGIVGVVGRSQAVDFVLQGLKRLEYRGYDSAGVSVREGEKLVVYKKEGKLTNLTNFLADKSLVGDQAIGHTRWATHGKVNETNAHPHSNEVFSIVHNGIIENATSLKEFLSEEGLEFKTETDSEVFLQLLNYYYKKSNNTQDAIVESFKKIEGNSAFVIQKNDSSDIWAIKRSAPLVCGENISEGSFFLSSDPYALVGAVTQLYFPEDEVLCRLSSKDNGIFFTELNGDKTSRFLIQTPSLHLDVSSKGDFDHYMLKEIHEQPELILRHLEYYHEGEGKKLLEDISQKDYKHFLISACGSAWHAGLLLKYYLQRYSRKRALVELASEFRYQDQNFEKGDIGFFISQSGETADTLACQELCRDEKLPTVSIVNVEGSTLYRQSDLNFPLLAGAEIGVASTKAFTLQAITSLMIAKSLSKEPQKDLADELVLLSQRIKEFLKETKRIKVLAKNIFQAKGFLFTGRGEFFPVALEGALKLKEIAYVHAEGYAAGELKHGPIALVEEDMVNIALVGHELYDKTISNIEEVRARKGRMVTIGPKGDKHLESLSDTFIGLDLSGLERTSPLLMNVVLQCLAYEIARLKGTDIDQPRNLAKSVTVE